MGVMLFEFIDKTSLTVLDFLYKQTIYTAILFVIIFAVSFALRKKSPLWHLGLWMLVLIRLLLPTNFFSSLSIRNLFDQFFNIHKFTVSIEAIVNNAAADYNNISELVLSNSSPNQIDMFFSWNILLVSIWIIGCLIILTGVTRKYYNSYRIIKNSSLVQESMLTDLVTGLCRRLKIRRTVNIISSEEFLSPFSVGILKPLIYIPESLLKSGDTDTVKSIISHEMIHIKQFDALWIKFQNILQIIFFFNPVVWYANRQINMAREQICDSSVLDMEIISPEVYGKSLIQVLKANYFGFDLVDLMPCFGSHKKIFKQRIQNITKGKAMKKQKSLLIVFIIFIIGAVVLPLACTTSVKDANVVKLLSTSKKAGSTNNHFNLVDDVYTTKAMNWIAENYINKELPDDIDDQQQLLLQISKDIKLPEKFKLLFLYNRDKETSKLYPQGIMAVEKNMILSKKGFKIISDKNHTWGIKIDGKGAREFIRVNDENLGKRLAVIVDNKIVQTLLLHEHEQIEGGVQVLKPLISRYNEK